MRVLLSLLPWLWLAALIWYVAACVAADEKPHIVPAAVLMLGALAAAAIWVPVAYAQRGYWAIGGEIFLIGLAAGLGAWMGGGGEP